MPVVRLDRRRAIAAARERFGGIDVGIASAGISGTPKPSTDVSPRSSSR